ncbi:hypothetical protein BD414DRAFT_123297 [Trametes punicea]|nr:hypothetical protein BD414DRAFT_123297 [Trametes punicea]
MDWWSMFRRLRRVIFAFIAIASLIWSAVLSLYLSKEWVHLSTFQRAIVLTLIGVNVLTSILLYLMIIVVFYMWKELLRVLFLLAIHIAPAILFTLFGFSFSCEIFDSVATCKIVDLIFFTSVWSITGLLLGYTVYLCIMSRVPRRFPLITPNDLLDTSPLKRVNSVSSVHSTTRLLSRTDSMPPWRSTSPVSIDSQRSTPSRTVPKRLFVAKTGVKAQVNDSDTHGNHAGKLWRGPSYGATIAQESVLEPSGLQSRFSTSTAGNIEVDAAAHMSPLKKLIIMRTPRGEHHSRQPSAASQQDTLKVPPRPLLLSTNPFMEPLSRHGTPETALSGMSFTSAPGNLDLGRMAMNPFKPDPYGNYLSPYSSGTVTPMYPHSTLQYGSSTSSESQTYAGPQVLPTYGPPYVNYSGVRVSIPERTHTATPSASSIHSMSPSIHFTDASGNTYVHPASLTPAHPSNGNDLSLAARLPPTVHLRSASDPFFRSYSTEPRLGPSGLKDDVVLPNPYVAGAQIRRYGSVPHVHSGSYGERSPYRDMQAYGNAGWRAYERGMARGVAAAEDPRWMDVVMKAAVGQS